MTPTTNFYNAYQTARRISELLLVEHALQANSPEYCARPAAIKLIEMELDALADMLSENDDEEA